ncbi:MAG: Fe-S cluster assembly protein HesB, partial [Acidimicrobiia bacterium]|nr:Fe-S cluster assembly protein HesB [Acidimicrobiia bacterium]
MNDVEMLHWTDSEEANRLLATDPLALLIGMLLDQQFPMERAFFGPFLLSRRLGRDLDAAEIAAWDEEELIALFKGPPAIHRYPGSMAKRTQSLCRVIVDDYDGDAGQVWNTASDSAELFRRLVALPGYGVAKS